MAAEPAKSESIMAKWPDEPLDTRLVRVVVVPWVKVVWESAAKVKVLKEFEPVMITAPAPDAPAMVRLL